MPEKGQRSLAPGEWEVEKENMLDEEERLSVLSQWGVKRGGKELER